MISRKVVSTNGAGPRTVHLAFAVAAVAAVAAAASPVANAAAAPAYFGSTVTSSSSSNGPANTDTTTSTSGDVQPTTTQASSTSPPATTPQGAWPSGIDSALSFPLACIVDDGFQSISQKAVTFPAQCISDCAQLGFRLSGTPLQVGNGCKCAKADEVKPFKLVDAAQCGPCVNSALQPCSPVPSALVAWFYGGALGPVAPPSADPTVSFSLACVSTQAKGYSPPFFGFQSPKIGLAPLQCVAECAANGFRLSGTGSGVSPQTPYGETSQICLCAHADTIPPFNVIDSVQCANRQPNAVIIYYFGGSLDSPAPTSTTPSTLVPSATTYSAPGYNGGPGSMSQPITSSSTPSSTDVASTTTGFYYGFR